METIIPNANAKLSALVLTVRASDRRASTWAHSIIAWRLTPEYGAPQPILATGAVANSKTRQAWVDFLILVEADGAPPYKGRHPKWVPADGGMIEDWVKEQTEYANQWLDYELSVPPATYADGREA